MTNNGNPFAALEGIKEKRALLASLSVEAKKVQKRLKDELEAQGGDFTLPCVNDILLDSYKTEEHSEFHTFRDWKKQGKQVKKGAKAFCIWSKPRKVEKEIDDVKEEYEMYGLAFLFSNAQVQ